MVSPEVPKNEVISPRIVGSGVHVKNTDGGYGTITECVTVSVHICPLESAVTAIVTR